MSDVTFLVGLIGSTVRRTWLQNMRMVRTDDDGYLQVVAPAGAPMNINIDAIEGNNVPQGGVNGMLPVMGDVVDGGAVTASWPVKIGAVARALPLGAAAAGQVVNLVTDLYRRLWVSVYGQVLETSLVDVVDHAASAGISYPSDGGLEMDGYKDLSFTGKFICGADNTIAFTVEGTNDEDATPANRDWIVLYAYRTDTNTVVNSVACGAAATATYGWDFDNCNYKYVRVRLVIVNGGVLSNTVIIKIRRKAL